MNLQCLRLDPGEKKNTRKNFPQDDDRPPFLSGHLKKLHRYINEDVVFVAAAPGFELQDLMLHRILPRRVLSERISI